MKLAGAGESSVVRPVRLTRSVAMQLKLTHVPGASALKHIAAQQVPQVPQVRRRSSEGWQWLEQTLYRHTCCAHSAYYGLLLPHKPSIGRRWTLRRQPTPDSFGGLGFLVYWLWCGGSSVYGLYAWGALSESCLHGLGSSSSSFSVVAGPWYRGLLCCLCSSV
jgi:hypothetical protein